MTLVARRRSSRSSRSSARLACDSSTVRGPAPLRAAEAALIRQAVQNARGNVAEAALALGISRATVYRKLGAPKNMAQ